MEHEAPTARRPARSTIALGGVALLLAGGALALLAAPSPLQGSAHAGVSPPLPSASGAGLREAAVPAAAAPALSSPGADPSAIALTWTESTAGDFENYTVFESSVGSDGPWTVVAAITTAATTTQAVTSLTPGADYWWVEQTYTSGVLLGIGAGETQSNTLATIQPTLGYLTVTQPTSSTVDLNWTNNATYGGPITFESYDVLEKVGSGAWTQVQHLTDVTPETTNLTGLVPSSSYAFYVNTTDCVAGCGTGTATDVATGSNTVTAGTPGPLDVTVNVERSVVDARESDYFSCTPSGGRSPYAFAWQFGTSASFISGSPGESTSFEANGSQTITCQVTDAGAIVANASTTILVNPAPVVSISLNRTAADVGQSISYSCNVTGGTDPVTLSWSFGDGTSALTANTTHVYGAAGNFGAACAVEDGAGESVLNTSSVAVSTDPVAILTISSLEAAPNASLSFSVALSNGSTPYSNLGVNFGDGDMSAGARLTHAFHEIGNYTVAGRGRDANGFPARTTEVVHVTTLALVVELPGLSVLRPGSLYSFSATPSGGAGAPYTVAWSFGDGATATGTALTHTYAKAGTFAVSVEATDRLGSSIFRNYTVSVQAPPRAPSPWSDPWLLLLPAFLVGATVDVVALQRYRTSEAKQFSGAAQYVLPTDPERTLSGVRTCRNCGTSNSAVRETCASCGATLPRSLFG